MLEKKNVYKPNILFDKVSNKQPLWTAADELDLNFSKAFNIVSCDLLRSKLRKYSLDEPTLRQVHNRLENCVQRVVTNGSRSG